jgi:hypothetical protein
VGTDIAPKVAAAAATGTKARLLEKENIDVKRQTKMNLVN